MEQPVTEFALDAIEANPLNPRKTLDKEELEKLTDSVREHGILQPVVLRPHPKGGRSKTPLQLVIGERRWRAAKAAGLETIPGSLIEIDDRRCLEIMLVENGRREDLDPVEEAETYHRLQKEHGLTLEEIAKRTGKSVTAVFQRVKLMACNKAVRKALAEGNLSVSVAELIGRAVHKDHQDEVLRMVAASEWEQAASYRSARDTIESEFTLRLKDVPWQLEDAQLDPKAGPCTTCPKRTGNQKLLFADMQAKDVCLDRECFGRKREAAKVARLKQAEEEGSAVLEGKAAAAVFDQFGRVKRSSGYVDLAEVAPLKEKGKRPKSLANVLGKRFKPPVSVVAVPNSDRILEVARIKDVDRALAAKGVELEKNRGPSSPSRDTQERNKTRVASAIYDGQIAALVASAEQAPFQPTTGTDAVTVSVLLVRRIARELYEHAWHDAAEATRRRRGLSGAGTRVTSDKKLLETIEKGSEGEVLGLILEILAQSHRPRTWAAAEMGFLSAVAPLYSVDLKAVASDVRAYLRKLKERREARKKKTAGKKAAAKKSTPATPRKKPARKKAPAT